MNPVEPRADLRQMGAELYATYTALVQSGFKPNEALKIIGYIIASAMNTEEGK